MNTAPKICITMIAVAIAIFLSSYFYYQSLLGDEYVMAKNISKVTSSFSHSESVSEPELISGDKGIYEERAILMLFGVASIISVLSMVVAVLARIKCGRYQLFVPLTFCAATIVGCIVFRAYRSGLYQYA